MEETEKLFSQAKNLLEQGKAEEALKILQDSTLDENCEVLFLKGEASFHLQRWGDSINFFRNFQSRNQDDSKAQAYIEMIKNILTFYHTDHFNP